MVVEDKAEVEEEEVNISNFTIFNKMFHRFNMNGGTSYFFYVMWRVLIYN